MGYITYLDILTRIELEVSKLFRAYGLYNRWVGNPLHPRPMVSKLFRAYGLYNNLFYKESTFSIGFKALSSLWVI